MPKNDREAKGYTCGACLRVNEISSSLITSMTAAVSEVVL